MPSVDAALTGRRLAVWSKTERRRGTCKFGCCPGGTVIERVMYTRGVLNSLGRRPFAFMLMVVYIHIQVMKLSMIDPSVCK